MSETTRNLIKEAEEQSQRSFDDMNYFIDKAIYQCRNGNVEEAIKTLKTIKLMHECDMEYRLSRGKIEIDWNDTSLSR